jgi:predicted lysophospholipase L1 biosynthesis ABC-type transport system permease subunit
MALGADPLVFAAAASVLLIAALAASYLPARRASRIDPLLAMRHEQARPSGRALVARSPSPRLSQ